MRLIKVPRKHEGIPSTIEFEEILGEIKVPYAILSHTWDKEEVTYDDVTKMKYKHLAGYRKIGFAMRQAQRDGYTLVWCDTCCIDKRSSAELSEAINSMYEWYSKAGLCYALLQDVTCTMQDPDFDQQFAEARWFTRGWTLQELLAPAHVWFFNNSGQKLDDKMKLAIMISEITDIQVQYIERKYDARAASVARRLSWAASRRTTRIEDEAYCLLGLMGSNIPLLYGEGSKAFIRLQEEIMKVSDDQTLFLWRDMSLPGLGVRHTGLLAPSPRAFKGSGNYTPIAEWEQRSAFQMTNRGLQIELDLLPRALAPGENQLFLARLKCTGAPAVLVEKLSTRSNLYARVRSWTITSDQAKGRRTLICVPQSASVVRESTIEYFPVRLGIMNQTFSEIQASGSRVYNAYSVNTELHAEIGIVPQTQSGVYNSLIEIPCRGGAAVGIDFVMRTSTPSPLERNVLLLVGVNKDTQKVAFQVHLNLLSSDELPHFVGVSEGDLLHWSAPFKMSVQTGWSEQGSRNQCLYCDVDFLPSKK